MAIIGEFLPTTGFTAGRGGGSQAAIAVHAVKLPLESIDAEITNCTITDGEDMRDVTFHYGVSEAIIHQYVNVEDRSWSFAVDDDWPLSGTLTGDPDRHTVNIAISTGFINDFGDCEDKDGMSDVEQTTLANLIADIAVENGIAIEQTHVFRAHGHLAAVDWDAILTAAADIINAVPLAADYELLDEFSQFPDGGVADETTPLIGQDGSVYTLPTVTPPTCEDVIGGLASGGVADATTELVGADCQTYTLPTATSGDAWLPDYVEFWGPDAQDFADGDNGILPLGTPPANAWGVKLIFNLISKGGGGFSVLEISLDGNVVANIGTYPGTHSYITVDLPVDATTLDGNLAWDYSTVDSGGQDATTVSVAQIGWLLQ